MQFFIIFVLLVNFVVGEQQPSTESVLTGIANAVIGAFFPDLPTQQPIHSWSGQQVLAPSDFNQEALFANQVSERQVSPPIQPNLGNRIFCIFY